MTPREEAISLVIRFRKVKHVGKVLNIKACKELALICVDEMLNLTEFLFDSIDSNSSKKHLEEVKEEINKL